jgi:hypothetical protein
VHGGRRVATGLRKVCVTGRHYAGKVLIFITYLSSLYGAVQL